MSASVPLPSSASRYCQKSNPVISLCRSNAAVQAKTHLDLAETDTVLARGRAVEPLGGVDHLVHSLSSLLELLLSIKEDERVEVAVTDVSGNE